MCLDHLPEVGNTGSLATWRDERSLEIVCATYSFVEGGVGALSVELRLVPVRHEVLDVAHLVVDGLQVGLPHLGAHFNSEEKTTTVSKNEHRICRLSKRKANLQGKSTEGKSANRKSS